MPEPTASPSDRVIAVELSAMRAGSTLLKALMAAADDISSLPEINFQKFTGPDARPRIEALCPERIVVLKRPAWFHEAGAYPRLPEVAGLKRVLLARDVHTCVASLRKMAFRRLEPLVPSAVDRWLAERYWARLYANLRSRFPPLENTNFWLRYEDLCERPKETTAALFAFLGSERTEGTDRYPPPANYDWRWGSDDGGPKIRALSVQPSRVSPRAAAAARRVFPLPATRRTRRLLGYAGSATASS